MFGRSLLSVRGAVGELHVCCRLVRPYTVGTQVNMDNIEQLANDAEVKTAIDPLQHHDYFGVRDLVKLKDLFDCRVHLGHKKGIRNEHMLPYLFGNRLGVDIIDIQKTVPLLGEALNFAAHIAYRKGVIMFVSRNLQMMPLIEKKAEECGEFSHCRSWKSGTFTNAAVQFGAITHLPDLCIFLSTQDNVFQQHRAVVESAKMLIPSIAVVDTSCDPRLITYPVPGNDDTPCAIELYCNLFKAAILRGKEKRIEDFGPSSDESKRVPLHDLSPFISKST